MDQPILVNFDIENGKEVVDALDRDGKTPNVALWAKLPDYENWRLVIASDRLDQSSSRSGYSEINAALKKAGIPIHRKPSIFLRSMNKPFIQPCAKPSHLRRTLTECASEAKHSAINILRMHSSIVSVEPCGKGM
jgi:hypothetical protein